MFTGRVCCSVDDQQRFADALRCVSMDRKIINPDSSSESSEYGNNHAIVANGTRYMSGQVGMDEDRNLAGRDITVQLKKVFPNIESILAEDDRNLSDMVKVTAHVVDPHSCFEDFNAVCLEQLDEPYPCHTVLGVEKLAGVEYLIELETEVPVDRW